MSSESSTRIIRTVTAASLFDGHDASINIIRRILQAAGAEVIHLGHNRSVAEIVDAAVQEDAHAICVSSYQGGHMEFFKYMRDMLVARGAPWIKIFGGGGGVIIHDEMRELHAYGIERIYHPEDGRRMGLRGIIDDLLSRCDPDLRAHEQLSLQAIQAGHINAITRAITLAEAGLFDLLPPGCWDGIERCAETSRTPILGITGTGGAGKSSLTDELIRRYRSDHPEHRVAILAVDPTRKRTGGALLGDRIRMNAIQPHTLQQPGSASPRTNDNPCFMRSFATRGQKGELSSAIQSAIKICKAARFDVIFVETSGIGQGDSDITQHSTVSFYVMTPEYGASSQLEKIDMLDYADAVVLNKYERHGGEDALRDIRKQVRRNREMWTQPDDSLPVFATIASQFNDPGVNALYHFLEARLQTWAGQEPDTSRSVVPCPATRSTHPHRTIIPPHREKYLGEISATVRDYKRWAGEQVRLARRAYALESASQELRNALHDQKPGCDTSNEDSSENASLRCIDSLRKAILAEQDPRARAWLDAWPQMKADWSGDEYVYKVREKTIRQPIRVETLSLQKVPRIALPPFEDHGELLRFGLLENLPGQFPYTAGVFPLKRSFEDPKRMFAGEGGPAKTNARFHYLCAGEEAKRLSTAFDSVTLYGQDPDERPDIYGKVGESGVSVPHLEDMKILYSGFDLLHPMTSVSMTINGPAPILLAMFFNTALDQQVQAFQDKHARAPSEQERAELQRFVFQNVRGTVQADILKEDQGQNTCIFSTEFALRMMGDIQEFFIKNKVRNYYSVSISGYHIAEAGANPISQLAFTLANGFTYVEYYLSRGMDIDDFAPNLSFFFSVGLEPEYTALGRVARRIWAIVVDRKYGGDPRSQKLKYHIQTSGRSLHAREIQFNDIRTTLQALLAWYDHCNSLHTNAYDEAITTPTEESVRRAMAVQLIISKEFGLTKNENPLQGSFIVEELTELVEEAVLAEFDRIDRRGGVLGAMETQYQRGKIQEESLYYEHKKHDGSYPIVGINTFQDPNTLTPDWEPPRIELRRSSPEEKGGQIQALHAFQDANAQERPAAMDRLRKTAMEGGNIFEELLRTTRVASLGQITRTLFEVGGEYRRNL